MNIYEGEGKSDDRYLRWKHAFFLQVHFLKTIPQERMTVHSVLTSNKKNIILSRDIVSPVSEGS